MIGKREIRTALTGALLFLAVGSLQACASDIAGPGEDMPRQANADGDERGGTCIWVGSVLHCD